MWSSSPSGGPIAKLRIRNVDVLENGMPVQIELDQRGVIIGRSATVDWSLPDPRSYISSRHCEIVYRDGAYRLIDLSTNGTFLNGSPEKITQPRPLKDGDVIQIGHYEVTVSISGVEAPISDTAPAPVQWVGWDAHGDSTSSGVEPSSWDKPEPMPAISGQGPMSGNWAAPALSAGAEPTAGTSASAWGPAASAPSALPHVPSPAAAPAAAGWDSGSSPSPSAAGPSAWDQPVTPLTPPSSWSSAVADSPAAPGAEDVWGKLAQGNVVDWARGGFGEPSPSLSADPLGLTPGHPPAAPISAPSQVPVQQSAPIASPTAPPIPAAAPKSVDHINDFFSQAGLKRSDIKVSDGQVLAAAGSLIRLMVSGLVVMLEARARAKAQLGAQSTSLEFDGNNPIKFARTPEQALTQLLNPAERGFMPSDRAVEDAFYDLQSHQVATLKAMQGALKATLDRFSPTAIKKRAESKGLFQRILPAARDAALWKAYEKEFGGVAQGSDEAFMDVFAKEFKRAYDEQSASRPRRGR